MYICAKGKEIHLQEGENTMTKQEIKKILKEALNYLKNKKAYDENPCETSEDDVDHMLQEDLNIMLVFNKQKSKKSP